jgi:hypothetical protein
LVVEKGWYRSLLQRDDHAIDHLAKAARTRQAAIRPRYRRAQCGRRRAIRTPEALAVQAADGAVTYGARHNDSMTEFSSPVGEPDRMTTDSPGYTRCLSRK